MEPAREAPWAEHEKANLLGEMLKSLPSSALINIHREYNVNPQWNDIALPHGRSLRSCQMAYNDIGATTARADYGHRPQLHAPHVVHPIPPPPLPPLPEISKKRPHPPEATPPPGRPIQPRPAPSYPGEFVSGPTYGLSPVAPDPPSKKKRGRPTKAEAQAKAEQAAQRGEAYPPVRRNRQSLTAVGPPPGDAQLPPAIAPGSGRVLAMASMTPQQPQVEQQSESSSGKKKRGKPSPLELEKPQRQPGEMSSPGAYAYGIGTADPSRGQPYSTFTPVSAPLPSADPRDREGRMEGIEETQPRTTTPHSFKDTVGI